MSLSVRGTRLALHNATGESGYPLLLGGSLVYHKEIRFQERWRHQRAHWSLGYHRRSWHQSPEGGGITGPAATSGAFRYQGPRTARRAGAGADSGPVARR